MKLAYGRILQDGLDGRHGLSRGRLTDLAGRFAAVQEEVRRRREAGEYGFYDLVDQGTTVRQITTFAEGVGQAYDHVLVLGIGGSALGTKALLNALRRPAWNEWDDEGREFYPRVTILENVDPTTVAAALERIDPRRVLVNVISKSGGTAETMAQYLVIRARLNDALGEAGARERLVLVTDPEKGALRTIARTEGIAALEIPSNVGGRFSVLTPVGVLPAALIGIDTAALLAGAADMRDRCASNELGSNIAGTWAALQYLADTKHGRHVQVLMPYSDALRDMAGWYVQLWAESLGKHRTPGDAGVGPTPLGALGATDQHSQVQLFMEGPGDKTVTFIGVTESDADVEIPRLHADVPELAYLGGHRLGELLDIERRATAGALARRGRPNMTLTLDRVDPFHLGALFMFLELATAYAGRMYGVNAFDQPGVELGKQFTYAMMGRSDAEQARREWDLLPKPDPKRIL
jgi:glucose-6-phosphate isomerase